MGGLTSDTSGSRREVEVQRERISFLRVQPGLRVQEASSSGTPCHGPEGGRGSLRPAGGAGALAPPFTPLARRPRAGACVPHSGDSHRPLFWKVSYEVVYELKLPCLGAPLQTDTVARTTKAGLSGSGGMQRN